MFFWYRHHLLGWMAEWSKALVLGTSLRAWVRIPLQSENIFSPWCKLETWWKCIFRHLQRNFVHWNDIGSVASSTKLKKNEQHYQDGSRYHPSCHSEIATRTAKAWKSYRWPTCWWSQESPPECTYMCNQRKITKLEISLDNDDNNEIKFACSCPFTYRPM